MVTVAFVQEYRSDKSVEEIKKLVPPTCHWYSIYAPIIILLFIVRLLYALRTYFYVPCNKFGENLQAFLHRTAARVCLVCTVHPFRLGQVLKKLNRGCRNWGAGGAAAPVALCEIANCQKC